MDSRRSVVSASTGKWIAIVVTGVIALVAIVLAAVALYQAAGAQAVANSAADAATSNATDVNATSSILRILGSPSAVVRVLADGDAPVTTAGVHLLNISDPATAAVSRIDYVREADGENVLDIAVNDDGSADDAVALASFGSSAHYRQNFCRVKGRMRLKSNLTMCGCITLADGTPLCGADDLSGTPAPPPVSLPCNDYEECTLDSGTQPACTFTPRATGTPCSGGLGTCQNGHCFQTLPAPPPPLALPCNDYEECTIDSGTQPACSFINRPDGTACSGGFGACKSGHCFQNLATNGSYAICSCGNDTETGALPILVDKACFNANSIEDARLAAAARVADVWSATYDVTGVYPCGSNRATPVRGMHYDVVACPTEVAASAVEYGLSFGVDIDVCESLPIVEEQVQVCGCIAEHLPQTCYASGDLIAARFAVAHDITTLYNALAEAGDPFPCADQNVYDEDGLGGVSTYTFAPCGGSCPTAAPTASPTAQPTPTPTASVSYTICYCTEDIPDNGCFEYADETAALSAAVGLSSVAFNVYNGAVGQYPCGLSSVGEAVLGVHYNSVPCDDPCTTSYVPPTPAPTAA